MSVMIVARLLTGWVYWDSNIHLGLCTARTSMFVLVDCQPRILNPTRRKDFPAVRFFPFGKVSFFEYGSAGLSDNVLRVEIG